MLIILFFKIVCFTFASFVKSILTYFKLMEQNYMQIYSTNLISLKNSFKYNVLIILSKKCILLLRA